MKDLQKFLPHIILAVTATAAFVILGVDHVLSGGEVFGGIMGANGFTSAGVVASGSISTAATAAVDVSHSASARTATPIVSSPATSSPTSSSAAATPAPATLAAVSDESETGA